MIPLIISRLIERGYKIYLPLHKSHSIVVQSPTGINQAFLLCELQNASLDLDRAPIARALRDEKADMLGVVDGITRTVWLIPCDAIEGRKAIRLGQRYEEYVIPEPSSLSYKEQREKRKMVLSHLKETARELGEKK